MSTLSALGQLAFDGCAQDLTVVPADSGVTDLASVAATVGGLTVPLRRATAGRFIGELDQNQFRGGLNRVTLRGVRQSGEVLTGSFDWLVGPPPRDIRGFICGQNVWSGLGETFIFTGQTVLRAGASITAADGAVLFFADGVGLSNSDGGAFTVSGSPGKPVYLTSIHDDGTPAGDVEGNANSIAPTSGAWAGLSFGRGTRASIDRAVIRYGGGRNPGASLCGNEDSFIEGEFSLTNSRVSHAPQVLLEVKGRGNVSGNVLSEADCGIRTFGTGPVTIANNIFEGSLRKGSAYVAGGSNLISFTGNRANAKVELNDFGTNQADLFVVKNNSWPGDAAPDAAPLDQDPDDLTGNWWGHLVLPPGLCAGLYEPLPEYGEIKNDACTGIENLSTLGIESGKQVTFYLQNVYPACTTDCSLATEPDI